MKELRESQDKSIAWAKEIGITQMMTASLGDGNGGSNPTMDQVKKAADEYNKIAAVAAKAGIQQGLHNEGFELAMVDGKRVYDMLFDLLDPKLVKFQFQMSTITSGLVAADYFNNHPGRFISMHVQDVDMNAPAPPPPPPPAAGDPASAGRRGGGGGGRGRSAEGRRRGHHRLAKTRGGEEGRREELLVEQNMELTKASVAALKAMKA
jgi:sugar phosphate isomerase/epimerase